MKTKPGFTVRMTIERPAQDVYNFVADPKNLAHWASGLNAAVKVRFVERNKYGVLDHYVSVGSGPEGPGVWVRCVSLMPTRFLRRTFQTLVRTPHPRRVAPVDSAPWRAGSRTRTSLRCASGRASTTSCRRT